MDTTKAITHVSLCAGYGGIDIGLSRAIPSLRTVAFSEIEAFACANLVSKMEAGLLDAAPIWTDLKTFPWGAFRDRVDILSGGYPCQPFSAAGKRLGTEDPRHLWPFIADGIRAMRPRVCFFENVEGHISLGLREVVSELEGIGYKVAWGIFSAREVGAPHQRKRVFIMAYDKSIGLSKIADIRTGWKSIRSITDCGELAYCDESRLEGILQQGVPLKEKQDELITRCSSTLADTNGSGSGKDWESTEPRPVSTKQPSSDSWGSAEGEVRQEHAWPSHHGELVDSGDCADPASGHAETHRLPSEYRQAICAGEFRGADATAWPSRPGQPQYGWEPPRVVANSNSTQPSEGRGNNGEVPQVSAGEWTDECAALSGGASEPRGEVMGDTTNQRCGRLDDEQGEVGSRETRGHVDRAGSTMGNGNSINWSASPEGRQHDPKARSTSERQTQPPLGGNPHGTTCGMDYAELSVTCDNRTDELRLLGNGVVPATAERAFRTLLAELIP